jgi:hypothetical protein
VGASCSCTHSLCDAQGVVRDGSVHRGRVLYSRWLCEQLCYL